MGNMEQPLYLDTNVLLYANEQTSTFHQSAKELLTTAVKHTIPLITSSITFLEIVHWASKFSTRENGILVAQTLLPIFSQVVPITNESLQTFFTLASIEQLTKIDTNDSVHLVAAIHSKCGLFVTEDKDLWRVNVPELTMLSIHDSLNRIKTR